jgi:hypothetical protein
MDVWSEWNPPDQRARLGLLLGWWQDDASHSLATGVGCAKYFWWLRDEFAQTGWTVL